LDSNRDTDVIEQKDVRPWVRYWARYIDVYFLSVFVIILQKIMFPTKQIDLITALVGIYFIWIFVEAQLMATWGTTPGKYLLKVKVRDADNNKLTLKTALIRGFLVWFIGMAMTTIFQNIAEAIAYFNLQKKGVTMWDEYCKCNVTHEDIGTDRIPLIIGCVGVPLIIVSTLNSVV